MDKLKGKLKKLSGFITIAYFTLLNFGVVHADETDPNWNLEDVPAADSQTLANSIVATVRDIAYPLGGAIIFISVLISGIMIIVNHLNPQKRSESMTSLLWIGIGGIVLGLALVITGLIINLAQSAVA